MKYLWLIILLGCNKYDPDFDYQKMLQATVRLQVSREDFVYFGTGTLVDIGYDYPTILTCGHVLRGTHKGDSIFVTVYQNGKVRYVSGIVERYDTDLEVGLVSLESEYGMKPLKLSRYYPDDGDTLVSVGCSGGDSPTLKQMEVIHSDPGYLKCTKAPAHGRSGGGLFNDDEELVGICYATYEEFDYGVYTGLSDILKVIEE